MFVLQGSVYHFRRRVPAHLRGLLGKSEVWQSLHTASRQIAKARAAALYAVTDHLFRTAGRMQQTNRLLLGEEICFVATLLKRTSENIAAGHDPTSLFEELEDSLADIETALADHGQKTRRAQQRLAEAKVIAEALPDDGTIRARLTGLCGRSATMLTQLRMVPVEADTADDPLAGLRAEIAALREEVRQLPVGRAAPPPPAPSPLFSQQLEAFLTDMAKPGDDGKPCWASTNIEGNRTCYRVFTELMGDRPVRDFTRADAGHYRDALLRLPFSYGKARNGESAVEAIARADAEAAAGTPVRRLKQRTAQKHFAAMVGYWKWLKTRGHVDDDIFSGFEFYGTKAKRKQARALWLDEDLTKILHYHAWYGPNPDRQSADFWLPLIGRHSGLRLEEMAQLRPEDIKKQKGTWLFLIQEHPAFAGHPAWSPKTEAGERIVAVHPTLIELGFLDLVDARRAAGAPFVFMDLLPANKHGKLSRGYSRRFSKIKAALGVCDNTAFHSFRHDISTQLRNDPSIPERWIDGILGHARDEASEGEKTYNKGLDVTSALAAVMAIRCPIDLSHLMPKR
jgi:integrase